MNIKAVDPDLAWNLFQGWAAGRLKHEPPGTVMTLVDYPALRHPMAPRAPVSGPFLYPAAFLQARGYSVTARPNGLWLVDGQLRTTFQVLHMINAHRLEEGMPEVDLEDLRLGRS